jgi:heat-inducible transcriptional repressor
MEDLTQRQVDILKTIIQEYTETGGPVGSEILEKKYKLGVSPATIRNEMVQLANKGYLKKTHFSSGRVPSTKGFRFYIQHLMKEKELSTVDEVAYKNSIWDERSQTHRLLSHATRILAQRTGLLAVTATESGDIYYAGMANLFSKDEFLNINLSRTLLELLDQTPYWESILRQFYKLDQDIMCMLGEDDFKNTLLEPLASVFGEFNGDKVKGFIGVVGPNRMYYDVVIPQVRYFSHLIEEILHDQQM